MNVVAYTPHNAILELAKHKKCKAKKSRWKFKPSQQERLWLKLSENPKPLKGVE